MPRRGLIIALVGVDGAGKSSAVRALASDPRFAALGVRRMYFGANGFWLPGVVRMNQSLDAVPVLRYLPRALMSLDRQLRVIPALYHRGLGRLVLCDRYYHDDIVARHVVRAAGTGHARSRRAAQALKAFLRPRMLYRPDHTFYLDVSPSTAYGRKQDYGFPVMLTMNSAYREVMSRMPDVTFIDAEQPKERVHERLSVMLQDIVEWRTRIASATGSAARLRHFVGRRFASLCLATPWLRALGASWLSRSRWWHPWVEMPASEVRALIAGLDRAHGRGVLRLTGMGALHHESGGSVRMTPLGRVSAAALSSAYRNWLRLAGSEHADLVDYRFAQETEGPQPVYAVERLHPLGDDDTATDRVRDRLRGEAVADHFRDLCFDELVDGLSIALGLSPDQTRALKVRPEPGFHGVAHGDLHLGNLLRNASGRVVMIDLDRVQQGAQVLDLIQAAVVAIEIASGLNWLSFFSLDTSDWPGGGRAALCGVSRNSLLAYFLWRQSVELQAMPTPPKAYLLRLRKCCERVLNSQGDGHDDGFSHHTGSEPGDDPPG